MKTLWIDREIAYDGRQLRSHWIFETTGVLGDAAAAFLGAADVPLAHMVDLADVRKNAPIFSRRMLHLIAEHFDGDLQLAIARQRLIAAIAGEELARTKAEVFRRGDDLFVGEKKLSVSIATISPLSTLIHFGINVVSQGAPVPAIGLEDLHIEPKGFGGRLLERYAEEIASMREARCKVRAVP